MHAGDLPTNIDAWMRRVEATQRELDTRLRNSALGHAAGSTVVTTDGFAQASFLYGRTYAAPPVVILSGGNNEHVHIVNTIITTTGFTAQFSDRTGTLLANMLVRCNWLAVPATLSSVPDSD